MIRKFPSIFSALVIFSTVNLALAADNTISNGLAPLKGVLGAMPGEFSFKQYDQGKLEEFAAQVAKERSEADKAYFLQAVEKIQAQFLEHLNATILQEGGLKQLSNSAFKSPVEWVTADQYLNAVDKYNVSKASLLTTIASLKAYGDQTLQASETVLEDGTIKKIRGYGQVNLTPVVEHFAGEITRIEDQIKNLKLNIKLVDGTPLPLPANSGKALDPAIVNSALSLPPGAIEEMRTEVQRLRRWSPLNDRPLLDAYTNYARDMVAQYLFLYGTSERFRFHGNAYQEEKAKMENELAQIFWSRSYLRARYGFQLGAMQTNYEKKIANFDIFSAKTKELAKFRELNAWTDAELKQARQNLRLASDVATDRSILAEVGEGWGIVNSTLQQANYFFTWAGGYHELADSSRVVLEMMAADLYEEMLVVQPGSLPTVQANYKARYYTDDKAKTQIQELSKRFDPQSWADEAQSDDPLANLGQIEVGSDTGGFTATGGLAQAFADVLVKCQQKEEVDFAKVAMLERSIRLATMGVKNTRGKDNTKGLRD